MFITLLIVIIHFCLWLWALLLAISTYKKGQINSKYEIMKDKKGKEKIVNLDLSILGNAKSEHWNRYEGLLVVFSSKVFLNDWGVNGGRETMITKPKAKDEVKTTYWYILESKKQEALKSLQKLVKEFKLTQYTHIRMGEAVEQGKKEDVKKEVTSQKKFSWVYYKYTNKKIFKTKQ